MKIHIFEDNSKTMQKLLKLAKPDPKFAPEEVSSRGPIFHQSILYTHNMEQNKGHPLSIGKT